MAETLAEMRKVKEQETDPVQKAQDNLQKARKIADLKKQIDTVKKAEMKEDGHVDVASAIRHCKTIIEDCNDIMSKLNSMGEQPLPSWLTDKITVAADDLNGARDYLMNPQTEEVELDEFTSSQIDRLKKEYESLRGKEKSVRPERFAQLRKMMKRFPKASLVKLAKADIPILSSGARASLVVNHGMKFSQIPEDFIPYIDVFADDNKELSEQKKGKFASVDPKVIDRIEKMMRGSRKEKDSIANMLNYLMPPEVVDMVRYKLKITQKRGKIKF